MPKELPKAVAKSKIKHQTTLTKPKDPKASHLYTDDNPATTIHGTGFKDKAVAHRTLDLIKDRSLTYQFQTVNTMYHRAKHHPAMKKKTTGSAGLSDMIAAMDIFRHWLDVTYPDARDAQRIGGFKPLLSKKCVERYLERIEACTMIGNDAKKFSRVYVDLPKGKKLANVLMDNSKPAEADWERKRYDSLDELCPAGEQAPSHAASTLWTEERRPSPQHLALIAWAWSPVGESKLP